MLQEIQNVKQNDKTFQRRWFTDLDMDLFIWSETDFTIHGFQLTYNKTGSEHAVTWNRNSGFRHNYVDNGESRPGKYKSTPILVCNGKFDAVKIANQFRKKSVNIEEDLTNFILDKLTKIDNC